MKERIYTIPVMDAFSEETECPMCTLEKKLEEEYVEYFLGPSLMEPQWRIDTNEKGFCRRHFEQLYNRQENRLGLGLIIETHLAEQNGRLKRLFQSKKEAVDKDSRMPPLKNIAGKLAARRTETGRLADELIKLLSELEASCSICGKLDYTMDRYIDVILYLWSSEQDFRALFSKKQGFCLRHLRLLLEGTKKYLGPKDAASFTSALMELQLTNLERLGEEVGWFTKKFDYRYSDAPWGNSRDALPRSIQKLVSFCKLI